MKITQLLQSLGSMCDVLGQGLAHSRRSVKQSYLGLGKGEHLQNWVAGGMISDWLAGAITHLCLLLRAFMHSFTQHVSLSTYSVPGARHALHELRIWGRGADGNGQ